MRVKKLPQILALHLKRFKYMEHLNRYIKVSYRVVFPLDLWLFNTVSADCFQCVCVYVCVCACVCVVCVIQRLCVCVCLNE